MSEKSGWFGNMLGRSSAKPLPTSAKQCPNGHPMALDWRECPYCKAAETAAARTRMSQVETDVGAPAPSATGRGAGPGPTRVNDPDDAPAASNGSGGSGSAGSGGTRRQTRVDGGPSASAASAGGASAGGSSARRHTSVLDTDDAPPLQPSRSDGGRRLTGIVFTFSWSKLGQLFDVRDGRNYVGSGTVSSEGNRPVDVLVGEDDKLSGAHFLILCQGEKYRIRDCDSTNGTFVNGTQIDTLGVDLADGSLIQAGSTLFAFQKVRPPSMPVMPFTDDIEDEPVPEPMPPRRPGHGHGEGNAI